MRYTIKPKETLYKGTIFRSRLEARWAAFFDIIGWHWNYEPFDLDSWSPDFSIDGHNGLILCEVKPISTPYDEIIQKMSHNAMVAESPIKIIELLLVGQSPFYYDDDEYSYIGWNVEIMSKDTFEVLDYGSAAYQKDRIEVLNGEVILLFSDSSNLGYCSLQDSWHDRITGKHNGSPKCFPKDTIKQMWGEACNRVRFTYE